MEKRTHAKSKSDDRLTKTQVKNIERQAKYLNDVAEKLGVSDDVLKASKEGRPLITKDEVDNMVKNVNEFEEIVDSMEDTTNKSISDKRVVNDINNFDRKPYPAFEIRDTLSDIPYVDDTSWPVRVDEHLGIIHLRPDKLRKGPYTFSFRGHMYWMMPGQTRDKDNWIDTFSIGPID